MKRRDSNVIESIEGIKSECVNFLRMKKMVQ